MKASEYDLALSANIKEFRKKHRITPHEMAEYLNMSESNYYRVERGERKLTYGQLMKIVERMNIKLDEFISLCWISDLNKKTSI